MIRLTFLSLFLFSVMATASVSPGFKGCGEYLLKGVLIKVSKSEIQNIPPLLYVVNAGTTSEMRFSFSSIDDVSAVSSYLEVPTVIKAELLKPMDGTKGELVNLGSVSIRKPDPLNPTLNTGLFFQASKKCLRQ